LDLEIRDATESDLPDIVEIYNSTIPSRMVSADTEPVSIEQRLPWFREHNPSRRPLWVAERSSKIIGWLSLGDFYDGRPAYSSTAEIGLYVKDGYRGSGIGMQLLEEALNRAPELGIKTLTAGAFAHNEPSIKLFERFGFEQWAYFSKVAELDSVERDLVILARRL